MKLKEEEEEEEKGYYFWSRESQRRGRICESCPFVVPLLKGVHYYCVVVHHFVKSKLVQFN